MRSARRGLEQQQRRWADAAGVAYDSRGYVRDLAANLWRPLDGEALHDFQRGSELAPGASRPGRMWSLWSSAALVANVFGHWRARGTLPLVAALGLEGDGAEIRFEEPLPTGVTGDPPTTDVALRWPSGRVAAVESKFGEWLVRRPRNKSVFKAKYFPPGAAIWADAGLPRCQALAAGLQRGGERFKLLNAAQLLKHALGLAYGEHRDPVLLYLYYDWPCREAEVHRAEIERFAQHIRGEIDFRVLTYQSLFGRLEVDAAGAGYRDYLGRRYFGVR